MKRFLILFSAAAISVLLSSCRLTAADPQQLWNGEWKLAKATENGVVTEEWARVLQAVFYGYETGIVKPARLYAQNGMCIFNRNISKEAYGDIHIFQYDTGSKTYLKKWESSLGRTIHTSEIKFSDSTHFTYRYDIEDNPTEIEYFEKVK